MALTKSVNGRSEAMTPAEEAKFLAELPSFGEDKRRVSKSLIVSRLSDAQLDAALALMSTRQKERWRAADRPAVNVDDPELLAVLAAIGADPAIVLA